MNIQLAALIRIGAACYQLLTVRTRNFPWKGFAGTRDDRREELAATPHCMLDSFWVTWFRRWQEPFGEDARAVLHALLDMMPQDTNHVERAHSYNLQRAGVRKFSTPMKLEDVLAYLVAQTTRTVYSADTSKSARKMQSQAPLYRLLASYRASCIYPQIAQHGVALPYPLHGSCYMAREASLQLFS
jgi:hypothetical protein